MFVFPGIKADQRMGFLSRADALELGDVRLAALDLTDHIGPADHDAAGVQLLCSVLRLREDAGAVKVDGWWGEDSVGDAGFWPIKAVAPSTTPRERSRHSGRFWVQQHTFRVVDPDASLWVDAYHAREFHRGNFGLLQNLYHSGTASATASVFSHQLFGVLVVDLLDQNPRQVRHAPRRAEPAGSAC